MINVLFFAQLKEEVGENQIELDVDSITVKQLKDRIQKQYGLSQMDNLMVSINEEFSKEEDSIHRGDEVAFIPPISGG